MMKVWLQKEGRIMGFFKDLLSKGVKDITDSVKDAVLNNVENTFASSVGTSKNTSVSQRIRNVVNTYYCGYTLEENVNPGIFYAQPEAWNYSFVLSRDGMPALTIMVLSGHNDYRKKAVELAHQASESAGVHCINIMEYLPSGEDYINQRIAESIK